MRNQRWYIEKIVQLFYPRRCPVCDDAVPMKEGLACEACRKKRSFGRKKRYCVRTVLIADMNLITVLLCMTIKV